VSHLFHYLDLDVIDRTGFERIVAVQHRRRGKIVVILRILDIVQGVNGPNLVGVEILLNPNSFGSQQEDSFFIPPKPGLS
jgi:hypothetical protein